MQLDDINLLDRNVFAKGVPHPWFPYGREHHPVFRHPEPHGPGFWVVSKHADVRAIGRDPLTCSSDQARGGVTPLEDAESPIVGGPALEQMWLCHFAQTPAGGGLGAARPWGCSQGQASPGRPERHRGGFEVIARGR